MTITKEQIETLSDSVSYLDIDEIGVIGGEESDTKAVLAHFRSVAHIFADPGEEGKCINCGRQQSGFLGAFSWGIIHGEGECANCGWPARAYHFVKMPDGETKRIAAVLQYHPNGLSVKGDALDE